MGKGKSASESEKEDKKTLVDDDSREVKAAIEIKLAAEEAPPLPTALFPSSFLPFYFSIVGCCVLVYIIYPLAVGASILLLSGITAVLCGAVCVLLPRGTLRAWQWKATTFEASEEVAQLFEAWGIVAVSHGTLLCAASQSPIVEERRLVAAVTGILALCLAVWECKVVYNRTCGPLVHLSIAVNVCLLSSTTLCLSSGGCGL